MRILTALIAAGVSAPLAAADESGCGAGLVCAADPQTVVNAIQKNGYRADLRPDPVGPYIASAASGYRFHVMFNDCVAGEKCTSLQFSILFPANSIHTAQYANGYNVRYRFAQAGALQNGELRLSYDINTHGGLTDSNFAAILANWSGAIGAFSAYAREQAAPVPPIPPTAPVNPDAAKGARPVTNPSGKN
jgi:hypothetical protein